ncbi:MAG TPA: MFS transporter [Acidimicrobiales bacterium]|nr:MFS transporter [Acidimicrobiales bacterium]
MRLLVLGVCSLSLFMVTLDNTIVNVALPSLQRQFHASLSELQWVADAYLVVIAALLLLAGSLGDRLSRARRGVGPTGSSSRVLASPRSGQRHLSGSNAINSYPSWNCAFSAARPLRAP